MFPLVELNFFPFIMFHILFYCNYKKLSILFTCMGYEIYLKFRNLLNSQSKILYQCCTNCRIFN